MSSDIARSATTAERLMRCIRGTRIAAPGLLLVGIGLAAPAGAAPAVPDGDRFVVLVQAMIPRTGMMDAQHPMPMNERYLKRFPQPARVGDLLGLPVLDPLVGLVRTAGCGAAGNARYRRPAFGVARYAAQRI
jgi:hypothetical protein